jgi:hypothetical protein
MNRRSRYGFLFLCIIQSIHAIAATTRFINNTQRDLALTITHPNANTQGLAECSNENKTIAPYGSFDYISSCCPWTIQITSPLSQKTEYRLGTKVMTPIPLTLVSPEDCQDSTVMVRMSLSGLKVEIKHSPIQGTQ